MMDRHSVLMAAVNAAAAGIARAYRLIRAGDGRRGSLVVKICASPDGCGTWRAWTSIAWPPDGTTYDLRGTIERQTPQERSDMLSAELTELERDIYRKPADRRYARSKWHSNDEAEQAIRMLREALNSGTEQGGGTDGD